MEISSSGRFQRLKAVCVITRGGVSRMATSASRWTMHPN